MRPQRRARKTTGPRAPFALHPTRARAVTGLACVTVLVLGAYERAWAGTPCEVPAAFSLAVEERPLLDTGSAGLIVVRAIGRTSPLREGDVIRQANGRRTLRCEDLEATAAEALAKGLVLLLAAERGGKPVAVALADSTAEIAIAAPAVTAPLQVPDTRAGEPAAGEQVPAPPPTPVPTATAVAHREAALPARAAASTELAAKAVAAAAVLGTVDEAARLTVPLAAYERRLDDAKNAIAALRVEGEGSPAVLTVIAEAFGYHETARDIRRYKAAELSDARVDQRGAGAVSLPYFSDSEVPRWIERYPFLSESLQQAPRATHLLLAGEMAGRWNPDQAVELLWERAAKISARLGAWASGK